MSPHDFWSMTPRELTAATRAYAISQGATPTTSNREIREQGKELTEIREKERAEKGACGG